MQCVFTLVWLIGVSLHIMRLIIKQSIFILVYEQLYQGTAGKRKKYIETADLTHLSLNLGLASSLVSYPGAMSLNADPSVGMPCETILQLYKHT